MDGLGRSVGDGISGLVSGALAGIAAAVSGVIDALGTALPAGALPVIGIGLLLVFVWAMIRR